MKLFALNLLLAFSWMAVNGDFSLTGLVVGFVLGHLVLWLAKPVWPDDPYFKRLWGGVGFFFWFLKELWVSSVKVATSVLSPNMGNRPAVVAMPLDAKTDVEITLLACCITLTPGTLSLDVSPDRSVLYIHANFAEDPEAVKRETKETMERRILEWLR
ncbi:Na+/H+ antiporter subunit E [Indioceanicola profundi]|uniref:Na+/H+ antiporter subunit E n=1 Tax=Indioceanicola profundi TaxID=2220096 RepID=UPI000E6AA31A|nr:Na+/H+ antiporter subunit E [Indioceanicola profundi]